EAEAVGEHLDNAFADDVDLLGRELLEDGEHQLLLAHGRGVLDLMLLGKSNELGRGFDLEVLEFHFPHGEFGPVDRNRRRLEKFRGGNAGWVDARSQVGIEEGRLGRRFSRGPDVAAGPKRLGAGTRYIRLRSVGCGEYSRVLAFSQAPAPGCAKFRWN